MAEIRKLSVGKVLDKLRSTDAPKESKITWHEEKKSKTLDQRLRAAIRRLERDQQAGSTERD